MLVKFIKKNDFTEKHSEYFKMLKQVSAFAYIIISASFCYPKAINYICQ
jgi:hypothetical protein